MNRVGKRLPALFVWAAFVLVLTPVVQIAVGAHTEHRGLNPQRIGSDWIIPWEFTSEFVDPDNVDWAVDVFFTKNATISRVKNAMNDAYPVGSKLYAAEGFGRFKDHRYDITTWSWDSDRGRKTAGCPYFWEQAHGEPAPWGKYNVLHYRVYAQHRDGVDNLIGYNQGWGQYIYGTTHIDHKESKCYNDLQPPYSWSGRSEIAEGWLAAWGRHFFGRLHVHEDVINLENGENRQDSGHWWENDGRATTIEVCTQFRYLCSTDFAGPSSELIQTNTTLTIDQVLHGSPGLVSVHGRLTAGEHSMANRIVHVQFDNADIGGWSTASDIPINVNGSGYYEYRDWPIAAGNWNIRARFMGKDEFAESQTIPQPRTVKRGYQIVNRHSGMCLSLSEGWKNYNGQAVIQWPCGGGEGQVFSFWEPFGNGWYNVRVNGKNRCIDVTNVSSGDGAWLQLYDCLGSVQHNQQWHREPIAGQEGWYALMPRHTADLGLQKCMDVLGQSTQAGTRVVQWTCLWAGNQQWTLQGVN